MNRVKYKRTGDDTFLILVDGQKPLNGRLKNWREGLLSKSSGGHYPTTRSNLSWLTEKQYNG